MKTLLAPLATLALSLCLLASPASGADLELNHLRSSYEAAVARAVEPLREGYEAELERLVEARTRNSDLDGVLAARAELERVGKGAGEDPGEPEGGGAAVDDELMGLRASYGSAVNRALRPLRETYERELRRIVQVRTRNEDIEGALAARAVLDALDGEPGGPGEEEEEAEMAEEESASGSSRRPPDELFVNRTWASPAGTAFTFREDGVCIREGSGGRSEGTWRRRGGVVISEVDRNSRATRYFRFVSETEAWYGNSARGIDQPVTPR